MHQRCFRITTTDVKHALAEKHPKAEECSPDALLTITKPLPNAVIFEQISPELIQRCSKFLTGSGGPTRADDGLWKYLLCSRAYGKHTYHLAEAVSGLAERLCSEKIHPESLQEHASCRLMPLDKGADNIVDCIPCCSKDISSPIKTRSSASCVTAIYQTGLFSEVCIFCGLRTKRIGATSHQQLTRCKTVKVKDTILDYANTLKDKRISTKLQGVNTFVKNVQYHRHCKTVPQQCKEGSE